ncbi:MAG: hypothetical protein HZB22_03380 [Deltaproteobacteria bacterium]|nr:hypothetical protein [Deltaproteobacteria bacterium]
MTSDEDDTADGVFSAACEKETTMTDIIDKAILVFIGLEKKARETLDALEKAGKAAGGAAEGGEGAGLSGRQMAENKVVEEGAAALKEFIGMIKSGKDKLEKEFLTSSEKVLEKLNVATQNDIEVIKEMARVAREKTDKIEKRLEEIERKLGGAGG